VKRRTPTPKTSVSGKRGEKEGRMLFGFEGWLSSAKKKHVKVY